MELTTLLTFGTVATSIGGYADPPMIWKTMCQHTSVQIGALTILAWQAGRQGPLQSLMIAVIFYIIIVLVRMYDDQLMTVYKRYVTPPVTKQGFDPLPYIYNPRWTVPNN